MIEKVLDFFDRNIKKIAEYIQKKNFEKRQLHQMTDDDLKKMAIQEGGTMLGLNKYEKELIRREREKVWLDNKLKQTRGR